MDEQKDPKKMLGSRLQDYMRSGIPDSFAGGRFLVQRQLGQGAMGVVYKVLDMERNMTVALKTLLHMDSDSIYYFKKEFRALHDLVHPNLCSLIELIHGDGGWFLTMELIDGIGFLNYVNPSCQPTSEDSWMDRAESLARPRRAQVTGRRKDAAFDERRLRNGLVGLCNGLNALHTAGKVHLDIKPSNVLVTQDDRVVLLDFGFVRDIANELQSENCSIAGSLAYMAPEQAEGETIGPTADLYAVGVILYRALTGQLPFDEGSFTKTVYKKLNFDAVRPKELVRGVPDELDMLCMRLLSRKPGDRPAVQEILTIVQEDQRVPLFSDATYLSLTYQESVFVGREDELKLLRGSYEESVDVGFRAVVIEGVSGIGKTKLVENFTEFLKEQECSVVVLSGRCYERESAPFKAFDGVIESLASYLKDVSAAEIGKLLPENIDLLLRLFPSLLRLELLRRLPRVRQEIEEPHELQRRAFDAFKEVLARLSEQHPVVLIIDDLQWTDDDSLALLGHLFGEPDAPSVLLILLSRFSEDDESSLWDWNALLPRNCQRIRLESLRGSDGEELARQCLERQNVETDVEPASIAKEAAGHPFYIAQMIHHIAQGGDEWRHLRIDEVISLRAKSLSANARKVLRILCVVGRPIAQEHLQNIANLPSTEFFDCIKLLRVDNLIRTSGPRKTDFVEPYHDRVREAIVAHHISVSEAISIHLNIGRYFLQAYSEAELDENLFFVVQHLYAGNDEITLESERLRLAELFFAAGEKALSSAAFVTSLVYFKESIELYPSESWETLYESMFPLYCRAAESAYITGDFSLTNSLAMEAYSQSRSLLDRARICETYILSLVAEGNPQKAIDEALDLARALGVRLKRWPSKLYVLMRFVFTKLRLQTRKTEKLLNLGLTTDQNIIAVRRVLGTITDTAYIHRPMMWPTILFKLIDLLIKYGVDHTAAMTFCGWAALNCIALRNFKEGYKYGRLSLRLLPQFDNQTKEPMTLFVWANFVQHWTQPLGETLPCLRNCYDLAYRMGNLPYMGWSGTSYCYHSFYAGKKLPEVAEKFIYYGSAIEHKKQHLTYTANRIFLQVVQNLMGKSDHRTRLEGSAYRESEMVPRHREYNQTLNLFDYYQCVLLLGVYFGSYEIAVDAGRELDRIKEIARGTYAWSIVPFYDSLACLKLYKQADSSLKVRLLRRVRMNQKQYRKFAASSSENYGHKYIFVEAERARVKGKSERAESLYHEAIRGALQNGFIHDAALACEFAADYYRKQGDLEKASFYVHQAISHYEAWGAVAKMEDMRANLRLQM